MSRVFEKNDPIKGNTCQLLANGWGAPLGAWTWEKRLKNSLPPPHCLLWTGCAVTGGGKTWLPVSCAPSKLPFAEDDEALSVRIGSLCSVSFCSGTVCSSELFCCFKGTFFGFLGCLVGFRFCKPSIFAKSPFLFIRNDSRAFCRKLWFHQRIVPWTVHTSSFIYGTSVYDLYTARSHILFEGWATQLCRRA